MEILSTGEKIKRARIYKGITLKELCENKISISKMSCIENGKVKADKDIIRFIADKIELDYDYLIQDVYEQITYNLSMIKENRSKNENIEEDIKHNLYYAVKYEYYELAFELIHLLFTYFLEEHKHEKIQLIISQYYDLYQKDNTREHTISYFSDMAKYLLQSKEYSEAIAYYIRLRELIDIHELKGKEAYASISYNEALCYLKLDENRKAYELLKDAIEYSTYLNEDAIVANIYQAYALVCIKLEDEEAKKYIEKTYECQKENPMLLAIAKGEFGKAYFSVCEEDKAIEEIMEGLIIFPKHNKNKYVEYLDDAIETLFAYDEYEKAYELTEEALDLSIESGEIKLIEKAYYFKGSILQKEGKYREAEMYMNLSLDSLLKFGTMEERKKRYMDMAAMYYNLGETKDSIKYFSLAMNSDLNI